MKTRTLLQVAIPLTAGATSVFAAMGMAGPSAIPPSTSPVYGVAIPEGYRSWEMIAPAEEADPLNELRVTLGNTIAIRAYENGHCLFRTVASL